MDTCCDGGSGGGGMTAGSVPIAPSQVSDIVDSNSSVEDDEESQVSRVYNIYIDGDVVDPDGYARDVLLPSIRKAEADGA